MLTRLYAVVLPVVVIAGGYYAGTAGRHAGVQKVELVPQPEHWVAFEADLVATYPDGTVRVGRFYRSSTGSERQEAQALGNAADIPILIFDIRRSRFYEFRRGPTDTYKNAVGTWTSQPMVLPARGWSPVKYRASQAGLKRLTDLYEGFEMYRLDLAQGYKLMLPDLNFFAVVKVSPTGTRMVFSKIRKTEPTSSLFEPPTDAKVIVLSQPGGIISRP